MNKIIKIISFNSGDLMNLNLTAVSQASSVGHPVLAKNFHPASQSMACRMIYNQRGKVDRMKRSMNSSEKNELWNIPSEGYDGDKEKDAAESRGPEEIEQEMVKMTREKAAEENQILGGSERLEQSLWVK
jgi:hypothetical protein